MAFVPVPKDLSRVKTKVALNLTKRQLICFSLAAVIGVPIYIFGRKLLGGDAAVLVMIVAMLPMFFLAMYEKDGQPAEKILRNVIRSRFLWSAKRVYKTENMYSFLNKGGNVIVNKEKEKTPSTRPPTKKISSTTSKPQQSRPKSKSRR